MNFDFGIRSHYGDSYLELITFTKESLFGKLPTTMVTVPRV